MKRHKCRSTKPAATTAAPQSQTKVNPSRSHGVGIWKGRRVVVGIRVDEKLYEAFKPVAKRVFGSVCRPIEAFMATVIAVAETGVNFGTTIEVHEIRIERNLRARRGLVVDEPKNNYYDPKYGVWKYVPVDPSMLNENGHVDYCQCRLCRRSS